ncbi:MAG: 50S ribosomal protein L24 [bacterium]
MQRIKKGDEVIVTTGKSKGQTGTVQSILKDGRILIQNVNMVKKNTKADPNKGTPGGIIEIEAPVDASNVMLFNSESGKGERIGFKILDDGRKVRVFRSNGEVIDA